MAGDPAFFLARCHKSPVSDATANAAYIAAAQPRVVLELIERIRAAEAKAGEPVAWRYETDAEHIARDMKEGRFPERSPKQQVPPFHAAPVDTAALAERVKTLEQALGKLDGDSFDAIMEVIGEGEKFVGYNLGKSKMRDWFLRRISRLIARPEVTK